MKTILSILSLSLALCAQQPVARYLDAAGNFSVGTAAETVRVANAGTTGTTVNKLAKLTGAPSTAVIAGTSDTSGIVGIVVSGAGTTGNAEIARMGQATCAFDGATTAGNYVQISSTVAADCHDAGSIYPTSGQVIGFVTQTIGSAGNANVLIRPDIQAASSSGGSGAGLMWGGGTYNTGYATGTTYHSITWGVVGQTDETRTYEVAPISCTAKNLYVTLRSAMAAGTGALVVTLRAGSGTPSNTALTLSIAPGSTAGVYSDTSHTVSITAGQIVTWGTNNTTGVSVSSGIITGITMVCQ